MNNTFPEGLPRLSYMLFLVVLLSSCGEKKAPYTLLNLEKIDSYHIQLNPDQFWGPVFAAFHQKDGTFFTLYDPENSCLAVHSYPEGERVSTVPIKLFGHARDRLLGYDYVAKDSIFLLLNPGQHPQTWHDSTLLRIDQQGNILSIYDVSPSPFWTVSHPDIPKDSVYFIGRWGLKYHKGELRLGISRYGAYIGDSLMNEPHSYAFAALDIKDDISSFSFKGVTVPSKNGVYFPRDYRNGNEIQLQNGHEIFSYPHLSHVWQNYPDKTGFQKIPLASYLFSDPQPIRKAKENGKEWNRLDTDFSQGAYFSFFYDPYRNHYFRIVRYPTLGLENASGETHHTFGFIMFDDALQKLGEGLIPDGYNSNMIFVPEGIALWKSQESNPQAMEIVYDIFSLEQLASTNLDSFRQRAIVKAPQLKEGGWKAYFREMIPPPHDKYSVLFVPADMGCPSCIDEMIEYFKSLDQTMWRHPLYCVIAGKYPQNVEQKLKAHQLNGEFPMLYTDQEGVFLSYVDEDFFQGRLLMFAQDQPMNEVILNPQVLPMVPTLIQDFMEE
ncbi:MAG: DUF4221 family protein [Bacteroidota bacterium]